MHSYVTTFSQQVLEASWSLCIELKLRLTTNVIVKVLYMVDDAELYRRNMNHPPLVSLMYDIISTIYYE